MDATRLVQAAQEPVTDTGSFGVHQAGGVLARAQRIADTLREQAELENDRARGDAERLRDEARALHREAQQVRDDAERIRRQAEQHVVAAGE